jgi:hypothetical protein
MFHFNKSKFNPMKNKPPTQHHKKFNYENRDTKITGTYGMTWLILLCYLHALRWPAFSCGLIGLALPWLKLLYQILSG